MNRGIDADTERHRDDNHVVDTDLPELEQVGKEPEEPEREQRAHAERDAARQEQLGLAERKHKRTEDYEDNHERKAETILLYRFYHVGEDELRRERTEILAIEIPAAVAFLEPVQGLRIPAGERTVDKADLSVAAVLFAEQVQSPFRNVFGGKRLFYAGELAERSDVRGILPFGTVEHAGLGKFTDFFDNFEAGLLRIERRHECLERKEAAQRRILFHMQAYHQGIVEHVQLFRLASHHRGRR